MKSSLWSGGLDSTIATYYFSQNEEIQPFHILIRNGGGKDAREIEAIDKIYKKLKNRFPNVLKPIRFKHKISPSNHRNKDMVELIRDKFNVNHAILGFHETMREGLEANDVDWKVIQKKTNVKIIDLTHEGYFTKREQFKMGLNLLGKEVLKLTWSCQLWWKNPCEKCFSCKERRVLFEGYL